MAFTTSEKMKMVIFQDEVNGVLTDLMARSHTVADATAVPTLMIKVIEDEEPSA